MIYRMFGRRSRREQAEEARAAPEMVFRESRRVGFTADYFTAARNRPRGRMRKAIVDSRSVSRIRAALVGPAVLFVITAGIFWKLTLTNQYTWLDEPDFVNQVLPWYQFEAGEWHQGRFPLWDPYHWGGQSLIGQGQPGAAYAPNWILFLLPLRNGW